MHRARLRTVCLAAVFGLLVALYLPLVLADQTPQGQVEAAWSQASEVGAYRYSTAILQTTHPLPLTINLGQSSSEQRFYLEGETNFAEEIFALTLWDGVPGASSALEMKVEEDRAYGRRAGQDWQPLDANATTFFSTNSNPLAYLAAARDVQLAGQETYMGQPVTRFTFTVDGVAFAEQLRRQMGSDLHYRGDQAPTMPLGLLRQYVDMTGTGEIWVDARGLPVREIVRLQLPEQGTERVEAEITTDFSGWAFEPGLPVVGELVKPSDLRAMIEQAAPFVGLVLLSRGGLVAILRARRSRRAYAALVLVVVFSMLVVPLLQSGQAVAVAAEHQEFQAQVAQEQERVQANEQVAAELARSDFDPHSDPLAGTEHASMAQPGFVATSPSAITPPVRREVPPLVPTADDSDGDSLPDERELVACRTKADCDDDGLRDDTERLDLGTFEEVADSDGDGLNDLAELNGYNGLYLNPRDPDTNRDGTIDGLECEGTKTTLTCSTTDTDSLPDAWDDDNDDDGLIDSIDLDSNTFVAPRRSGTTISGFGASNPLALQINELQGKPLLVDFQVRPSDKNHLWLGQTIYDWPKDDTDGQIVQKTDVRLARSGNDANGDMRLTPMLEIEIPADAANFGGLPVLSGVTAKPALPALLKEGEAIPTTDTLCSAEDDTVASCNSKRMQRWLTSWLDTAALAPFQISVRPADERGTLVAYVPLVPVLDAYETPVAFAGQMYYHPRQGSWGTNHKVRMVWMVQVLTQDQQRVEVCKRKSRADWSIDELIKFLSRKLTPPPVCEMEWVWQPTQVDAQGNPVPQMVKTYTEEWYMTGMAVREDHGVDLAVVLEDPTFGDVAQREARGTYYEETLWKLTHGLASSFIAGRDDMTLAEVVRRFNATSTATNEQRWGIPAGTFQAAYYPNHKHQIAALTALTTITAPQLLNQHFVNGSTSRVKAPALLILREERMRSASIDRLGSGMLSHQVLSLNMNTHSHGATPDTLHSMQLATYHYKGAGVWDSYTATQYWPELQRRINARLSEVGTDGAQDQIIWTDPAVRGGGTYLGLSYYTSLRNSINATVEIDDEDLEDPDQTVTDALIEKNFAGGQTLIGALAEQMIDALAPTEVTAELPNSGTAPAPNSATPQLNTTKLDANTALTTVNNAMEGKLGGASGGVATASISGPVQTSRLQRIRDYGSRAKGYVLGAAPLAVGGMAAVALAVQNQGTKATLLNVATHTTTALEVIDAIEGVRDAYKAYKASKTVGTSTKLISSLRAVQKDLTAANKVAGPVGLVLEIGVAVGLFVYQMSSSGIEFGSVEFMMAFAAMMGQIIATLVLFVLGFIPVIGQILVAVIALIDALMTAICAIVDASGEDDDKFSESGTGEWICGGVSGAIAKGLADVFYKVRNRIRMDDERRLELGDYRTTFKDPAKGLSPGNTMYFSLDITGRLVRTDKDQDDLDYVRSTVFRYLLSDGEIDLHDSMRLEKLGGMQVASDATHYYGDLTKPWLYNPRTAWEVYWAQLDDLKAPEWTPEVGINQKRDLYLNEGWIIETKADVVGISEDGMLAETNHIDLGEKMVYDILPATLNEFITLVPRDGGHAMAWDGVDARATAIAQERNQQWHTRCDAARAAAAAAATDHNPFNDHKLRGECRRAGPHYAGREWVKEDFYSQFIRFPRLRDADGDGLLTTAVQGGVDLNDTDPDSDDDGLSDLYEYNHRLNRSDDDSDNDGLTDRQELGYGTDPWRADSDRDLLPDPIEIKGWPYPWFDGLNAGQSRTSQITSDPLVADTDGDTLSDKLEKELLFNPRVPSTLQFFDFKSRVEDPDGYVRPGGSIKYDGTFTSRVQNQDLDVALEVQLSDGSTTNSVVTPRTTRLTPRQQVTLTGQVNVRPDAASGPVRVITRGVGSLVVPPVLGVMRASGIPVGWSCASNQASRSTTCTSEEGSSTQKTIFTCIESGYTGGSGCKDRSLPTQIRNTNQPQLGANSFTIVLAVKPTQLPAANTELALLSTRTPTGSFTRGFQIFAKGQQWGLRTAPVSGTPVTAIGGTLAVTTTPTLLMAIVDLSENKLVLYQDGLQVAEQFLDRNSTYRASDDLVFEPRKGVTISNFLLLNGAVYPYELARVATSFESFSSLTGINGGFVLESTTPIDGKLSCEGCTFTHGVVGLGFELTNNQKLDYEHTHQDGLLTGHNYPGSNGEGGGEVLSLWVKRTKDNGSLTVFGGYNIRTQTFTSLGVSSAGYAFFSAGGNTSIGSTEVLEVGRWYHIVWSVDRKAQRIELFVNGVSQSSLAGDYVLSNESYSSVSTGVTGNGVAIDELSLFATRLSTQDIQTLMNRGPVLNLHLDELQGTTSFTSTSRTPHAATCDAGNSRCPTAEQDGQLRGALHFNGAGDALRVNDHDDLDLAGAFTIAMWVKPTGTQGSSQAFISKGANYQIGFNTFNFGVSANLCGTSLIGTQQLSRNQWNHVAVTYAKGHVILYVNGLRNTGAYTPSTCVANTSPVLLGTTQEGAAGTFRGDLDEVVFMRSALGLEDIETFYRQQVRWYDQRAEHLLTVDAEPPTVTLDLQQSTLPGRDMVLAIAADDATSKVTRVYYQVDGGTWYQASQDRDSWLFTFNPDSTLAEGQHTVTVHAYDVVDNYASSSKTVTIDATNPTLTLATNTAQPIGAVTVGDGYVIPISGTLSDSGSGLSRLVVRLFDANNQLVGTPQVLRWTPDAQGAYPSSTPWTVSYPLSTAPHGTYQLQLQAEDGVGNSSAPVTVLWLALDEAANATSFIDASGLLNIARCSGASCPTAGQDGVLGKGLRFDGSDDYLIVENRRELNPPSQMALSLWIKPESWNSAARLIQKGQGDNQYRLAVVNNQLTFTIAGLGSVGGTLPSVNTWHHIGAVYTGSQLQLWIDGQLAQQTSISGRLPITTDALYLGAKGPGSPATERFKGWMDDARIYDRSLTQAQVEALASGRLQAEAEIRIDAAAPSAEVLSATATLASSGVSPTLALPQIRGLASDLPYPRDPQLHLNFEDQSGSTTFVDGSRSMRHVTCAQAECPAAGASGQLGTAVQFDGQNDSLNLPPAVIDSGTNALTFASWVYWGGGAAWQRIFDFGKDTSHYMFLTPRSNDDTLRFAFRPGANEWSLDGPQLPTNQWVHVAVTYDGTYATLWHSGVPVDMLKIAVPLSNTLGSDFWLGKSHYNDPRFSGRLDDVLIYNRALSADEIAGLATPIRSGITTLEAGFIHARDYLSRTNTPIDWLPVTLDAPGQPASTWELTIPAGLEGPYQLQFRVVDAIGNETVTPPMWQGEIDTLAPRVTLSAANGQISSQATDFNLTETSLISACTSNTTTTRANFNEPWYTRVFSGSSQLQRLYTLTQTCPGSTPAPMRVCDRYGNCTQVGMTGSPPRLVNRAALPNPDSYRSGRTVVPDMRGGMFVLMFNSYHKTTPLLSMDVDGDPQAQIRLGDFYAAIAGTADGTLYLVDDDDHGHKKLWRYTNAGQWEDTSSQWPNVPLDQPVRKFMIDQSGNLYFRTGKGTIRQYLPSSDQTNTWTVPEAFLIAPDQTGHLYVSAGREIIKLSTSNGAELNRWSVPADITALAVSPAGNLYVFYKGDSSNAEIFSPTGTSLMTWTAQQYPILSAAFTNQGQLLAMDSFGVSIYAILSEPGAAAKTPAAPIQIQKAPNAAAPTIYAELELPPILRRTEPITLSGLLGAEQSLQAVTVTVNATELYTQAWTLGEQVTETEVLIPWTPTPGINNFTLTATDWQTGTVTLTGTVEVDVQAPSLSLDETLITQATLVGGNAELGITTADNMLSSELLLLTATITETGTPTPTIWQLEPSFTEAGWVLNWPAPTVDDERYDVEFSSTDLAGNTAVLTSQLRVDLVGPTAPQRVTLEYGTGSGGDFTASGPITPGAVISDVLSPTLQISWTATDADHYRVEWARQVGPETLAVQHVDTFSAGTPLVATFATTDLAEYMVTLISVDALGNETSQMIGPIGADYRLTPRAQYPEGSALQGQWAGAACNVLGQDIRLDAHTNSLAALNGPQRFATSWDSAALSLAWAGADWDRDGDLFIYLDTRPGGSERVYNPYPATANTTRILLPATALADGGRDVLEADHLIWATGSQTATLLTWSGSEWQPVAAPWDYEMLPDGGAPLTAITLPWSTLGIADPAATPLELVALASEEAGLRLWASAPAANLVNGSALLGERDGELQVFALTSRYRWAGLGAGVCPASDQGQVVEGKLAPASDGAQRADLRASLDATQPGYGFSISTLRLLNAQSKFQGGVADWSALFAEICQLNPGHPDCASGGQGMYFEGEVDLGAEAAIDTQPLGDGTPITYTLRIHNAGTQPASGVTAMIYGGGPIALPDGVFYNDAQPYYYALDVPVGTLAPGEERTINIRARIDTSLKQGMSIGEYPAGVFAYIYDDTSDVLNPLEYAERSHPVDIDPPDYIEIQSPTGLIGPGEQVIGGVVSDASTVPTLTITLNGDLPFDCINSTPESGRWGCETNISGVADGAMVSVSASAIDGFGQQAPDYNTQDEVVSSAWKTFIVDAIPPTLTLDTQSHVQLSDGVIGPDEIDIGGTLNDNRLVGGVEVCDLSGGEQHCWPAEVTLPTFDPTIIITDTPASALPLPLVSEGDYCFAGPSLLRTFAVTQSATIADVDVGLTIEHPSRGEVQARLLAPDGTEVRLVADQGTAPNIDVLLDDAAAVRMVATEDNQAHNIGGTPFENRRAPNQQFADLLHKLNGREAQGTWTLEICDPWQGNDGSYVGAELRIRPRAIPGATSAVWHAALPLPEGVEALPQALVLYGIDSVGNRTAPLSISYTADHLRPRLDLQAAAEGGFSDVQMSGTITDAAGLANATLTVLTPGGATLTQPLTVHGATWSYTDAQLVTNLFTSTVVVTGSNGLTTTQTVSFTHAFTENLLFAEQSPEPYLYWLSATDHAGNFTIAGPYSVTFSQSNIYLPLIRSRPSALLRPFDTLIEGLIAHSPTLPGGQEQEER